MKNIFLFILTALVVVLTAALLLNQGNPFSKAQSTSNKKQDLGKITIGATSGPYSDMVKKAIQPSLEQKGYQVEVVEYSDYIQPNKALQKGDLDANLYQHRLFTKQFNAQNKTTLTPTIQVPTAPMGIYSGKYKSFNDVPKGAEIAIPNDPVNAARAFNTLKSAGVLTISKGTNPLTVSEKDVEDNPLNLKFVPVEAAQLPRSAGSIGLSAVPGNYALASKMDLTKALQLEKMDENYRNRIVVKTDKVKDKKTKAIEAVIQSDAFEKVIDAEFKGFDKPKKGQ